ncbi:MAG: hypothetical protein KTR14_01470 [Vampirovibrio sp.]|nr:hypothetical protein [Vampirovibrio sp.]
MSALTLNLNNASLSGLSPTSDKIYSASTFSSITPINRMAPVATAAALSLPNALTSKAFNTQDDTFQTLAAARANQESKSLASGKKKLYGIQIPLAGAVGALVYTVLTADNKQEMLIQDIQKLLSLRTTLLDETRRLRQLYVQEALPVSTDFRSGLARLDAALMAGSSPLSVSKHLHTFQETAANMALSTPFGSTADQYLNTANKVLQNKDGLMALTQEPLMQKWLGKSQTSLKYLLHSDRAAFLNVLFEKALMPAHVKNLNKIFTNLKDVHHRIPRLISIGAAVALAGYFIIRHETQKRTHPSG